MKIDSKFRSYGLLMSLLLTACSTTPDPAEICTSSWIEARADRAIDRIETRLAKTLNALQSAGERWVVGETPGPIQMFRLSQATKNLEKELTDGRGVQDLRMLARTCNDADLIRTEMVDLLKRQNMSDELIQFLENTGILENVIAIAEGRERQG